MERLTAIELGNRATQEGVEYTVTHYYDKKDLKTIKDKNLKQATFLLIEALENFYDALEEATFTELST